MRAEAAGQLAHALDRRLAALADDIGRAERARQRDAIGMTAEHDDLLGAEPAGGDHAAQTHGAVTDDRDHLARAALCGERGMVARAHHVRQRQQRRHQRVIRTDRKHDQRPVRLSGTRTASPWPPSSSVPPHHPP